MKKTVLAAAAVVLLAGGASAATFTLGSGSDDLNSVTLTSEGSTAVVTAYSDYNAGTTGLINRHNNGWGVSYGAEEHFAAGGEALAFDFSPITHRLLQAVIFEKGPEDETVDLYIDGVYAETFTIPSDATDGPVDRSFETFSLSASGLRGEVFAFVATSPDSEGWRGIRMREISVAAVPLPAGAGLLLTGFGLMALRKRRKKA
ncbi:putative secreted protein [Primorskyibacter sedentarius]|uniref:Putative secreted protein n=1 Tax=Primorskyibacter sedentarius TaxID=745311 RepID=A0A4R3J3U8_9RHOB|nr:VPLPA-CTERM sorting domain-containing protein [Primorskyibacter sedentarius]TCS59814.1 putative secreted protein [Primorskyibacter sedentarius]